MRLVFRSRHCCKYARAYVFGKRRSHGPDNPFLRFAAASLMRRCVYGGVVGRRTKKIIQTIITIKNDRIPRRQVLSSRGGAALCDITISGYKHDCRPIDAAATTRTTDTINTRASVRRGRNTRIKTTTKKKTYKQIGRSRQKQQEQKKLVFGFSDADGRLETMCPPPCPPRRLDTCYFYTK